MINTEKRETCKRRQAIPDCKVWGENCRTVPAAQQNAQAIRRPSCGGVPSKCGTWPCIFGIHCGSSEPAIAYYAAEAVKGTPVGDTCLVIFGVASLCNRNSGSD